MDKDTEQRVSQDLLASGSKERSAKDSKEPLIERPVGFAAELGRKEEEEEANMLALADNACEEQQEQQQERQLSSTPADTDAQVLKEEPLLAQATTSSHRQESPQIQPSTSSSPDAAQEYRLKDIQWVDLQTGRPREVKIATQNANGPCPLLALTNALVLSRGLVLGHASQKWITSEDLLGLLANHLLLAPVSEHDLASVLALLPSLTTGLNVDPRFSNIHDFADPPVLFQAFNIDLVHGWVAAPHDPPLLHELGYEAAVEYVLSADEASHGRVLHPREPLDMRTQDAILLNKWLLQNASQLTDHGLQILGTKLPSNHICVMFRNNHFTTLFKRRVGELFLLCTDHGVASDDRIVWESLRDVRQLASEFLDSGFRPLTEHTADDYVRKQSRDVDNQIESDFAFALSLQEGERQQDSRQDRLPPGMAQGSLYGVPEAKKAPATRQAPADSAAQAAKRKAAQDRCVMM
ncbi:hypothetical protein GGI25_002529 [Coemansia spiralis]|uniref:MINDY deubiquitinase domain-containing protein n=1 Tax=Coemansia spiralis TaxID=417178 RepID=A0A9W8G3Q3_9FUNG|nr:hypothetical protein GGI25_002529 [Coemansia spiralis]